MTSLLKNKIKKWVSITFILMALLASVASIIFSVCNMPQSGTSLWISIPVAFMLVIALCTIYFKWEKYMPHIWIVVLLAFICPLYCYISIGFEETSLTKFTLEYMAVIFSGVSIIFVITTLVLQRQQLKDSNEIAFKMYDAEVMKLINEFLSKEMSEYRNLCDDLRNKLRCDREDTVRGLEFAFERQIRDDYYKNPEWIKFKESVSYKEYAAFTRLVRYFDTISHYSLSANSARAIHFYYVWWRSFFKDVESIFRQTSDRIPVSERQLSFMPNWVGMIERLDNELSQKKDCPLT